MTNTTFPDWNAEFARIRERNMTRDALAAREMQINLAGLSRAESEASRRLVAGSADNETFEWRGCFIRLSDDYQGEVERIAVADAEEFEDEHGVPITHARADALVRQILALPYGDAWKREIDDMIEKNVEDRLHWYCDEAPCRECRGGGRR